MTERAQLLVLVLVDAAKLEAVLEAWNRAGITGVTAIPSVGMRRARGLLSAFWPVEQATQRTLWSVVEDPEVVRRAMQATIEIIGDFANPNSGILFALPVNEALGLKKRLPQPAEETPEPAPRRLAEEGRLSRSTLVEDVDRLLQLKPTVVREDEPIHAVARKMAQAPNIRTLCVVDHQDRLVGLIPGHELGEDILFHIMPEEFLREVVEMADVEEFVDRTRARLARDAMKPPVWVGPRDTVLEVFKRMHDADVDGVPIVDEELHVTGYVNLVEFLRLWLAV